MNITCNECGDEIRNCEVCDMTCCSCVWCTCDGSELGSLSDGSSDEDSSWIQEDNEISDEETALLNQHSEASEEVHLISSTDQAIGYNDIFHFCDGTAEFINKFADIKTDEEIPYLYTIFVKGNPFTKCIVSKNSAVVEECDHFELTKEEGDGTAGFCLLKTIPIILLFTHAQRDNNLTLKALFQERLKLESIMFHGNTKIEKWRESKNEHIEFPFWRLRMNLGEKIKNECPLIWENCDLCWRIFPICRACRNHIIIGLLPKANGKSPQRDIILF